MIVATAGREGGAMAGKGQKTTPVRMSDEAIKWARIASGYTGESMAEYVSRTVAEQGMRDAERLHAGLMARAPKRPAKEKEKEGGPRS